ncbi:MAG: TerB family tellurite resistance protein [Ignavibacteriaceae bacterium]|nr:TerB family tellurite resistance protein [Ignavibacteriaceae bacterium]
MFDLLRKIVSSDSTSQNSFPLEKNYSEVKRLQVATCAIFLEMAKSDDKCTEDERQEILSIMQNTFNLEKEYAYELIELAKSRLVESISIYEFTGIINENFSTNEKFELMKNLWRLIYTDQRLDKYEDQLVKKIGKMLHLEHKDIIAAKLMVKTEIG